MYKFTFTILLILILPGISNGCAWENIPEEGGEKDFRVRISMRVQGQIDPNLFYFFVFNFSGNQSKKPKPDFEHEERGMYWQAYYMYGNPRLEGHDFYRGVAGKTKDGRNRLSLRPIPSNEMFEFVPTSVPKPGSTPSGNTISLELDFGKYEDVPSRINLNMMVSSLPFDRIDNPVDDLWEAFVYDSFLFEGVTLNITGYKTDFHEQDFKVEVEENLGENPPPNASIVFWRVLLL